MDPFTNQPYAFDDSGVSADPREVEFNNGIREITVRYFTLCVKIILIQTQYKCLFILSFNVDFGYGWMRLIRCSLWPALIAQKI